MTSTPLRTAPDCLATIRLTATCLMALLLSACHAGGKVGGPCTYGEPVAGQVEVVEVGDHYIATRLTHIDNPALMQRGDELILPVPRENGARKTVREGETHDVVLRMQQSGTCVPVQAGWAQAGGEEK
ncbi:MAG: hypothetical protein LAT61_01965 [Alcanivorax sp.]|nr:hypothetical protein [Alcanivorax sp.]